MRCAITLLLLPWGLLEQPVVAATTSLPNYDRVRILAEARPIQDFDLTDQDGQSFRLNQLRGRVALVFFGFTNCPDVCPLAMQRMRQLEDSSEADLDDVAFVLISVDGERDTPDVMKAYLEPFSPRFIGLTGEPGSIKAIAKEFSAAFYKESAFDGSGNYNVTHSPQIFVLDSTGQLRAEFYNASTEAMRGVTLALLREAHEVSGSEEEQKNKLVR